MSFLWETPAWPELRYDAEVLLSTLLELTAARASLSARLEALGLNERGILAAEAFQGDALGTSRIEGEDLAPESVRSSIAHRLGLGSETRAPAKRDVEGLVEMLDDATRRHDEPLTEERLFAWHAALFPVGISHLQRIAVGAWREEAVVVQSGPIGGETTHFKAPPANEVSDQMAAFLVWWEREHSMDSALKAGLAHLWFETIHPFDDGNGRIGRAIMDMALAAGDQSRLRFYSVSAQIDRERGDYYRALEEAQRGALDVTPWLRWFLGCVLRAVRSEESNIDSALLRVRLRGMLPPMGLGPRQLKVLHKLIEHEPLGFEGGLTNAKYRSMTGASKATATRDLTDLAQRGLLVEGDASGRSTRYRLSTTPEDES